MGVDSNNGKYYAANMKFGSGKDIVESLKKAHSDDNGTCKEPFLPDSQTKEESGWTKTLVLAGVVTVFGACIPTGYNIGSVNAPQNIIRNFCNESIWDTYGIYLDETQLDMVWATVVSIFIAGGVIGALSGGSLADRFGRKKAIVYNLVLCVVSSVLMLLCKYAGSVEMLLAGRVLAGLAAGLSTSVVPLYLTEIANPVVAGSMGTLCPLGVTAGVPVAQIMGISVILGRESTWSILLALYGVLSFICLLLIPLLPESPRFLEAQGGSLVKDNSIEEGSSPIPSPSSSPELCSERQEMIQTWGMWRVISTSSLRWPLILVLAMQCGQQLSGINAVFYYSVMVFEGAGLGETGAQAANVATGVVNACVATLAVKIVQKVGRRPLAIFSVSLSAVALVALEISITYLEASGGTCAVWGWASVSSTVAYVLFYGIGLGPLPYFIGAELFPPGPRAPAMAMGSAANWLGNLAVGALFPLVRSVLGPHAFLPFAISTFALLILLIFKLPETKPKLRETSINNSDSVDSSSGDALEPLNGLKRP